MKNSLLLRGLTARNSLLNLYLRVLNVLYPSKNQSVPLPNTPRKILLSNIANLGDVIIATAVIPALKRKYPNATFSFLTSSYSSSAIQGHPDISATYTFDHVKLGIAKHGLCKALLHHFKTQKQTLTKIRGKYDIAIDLQPYYPNSISLLYKSGIPFRLGYSTGGFSNLLTHPFKWTNTTPYLCSSHLSLLDSFGVSSKDLPPRPYYPKKEKPTQLENISNYICVSVGSSNAIKEWSAEKWILTLLALNKKNSKLVLTGKGARELKICNEISEKIPSLNLCNQLSFSELIGAIQNAKLLLSVDTVSVHIAATTNVPTIVIHNGIVNQTMWLPQNSFGISHPTKCSPCFRKNGCKSMDCVNKIEPMSVVDKVNKNETDFILD